MSLWAVLVTGLFAGGASCAAVQGGLLAGVVARRHGAGPESRADVPEAADNAAPLADALPVAGFLAGKLVSHALLGAALGLLGDAVQVGFRTRAALQVTAGVVMVVLAADLLGVRAVRRLVPEPPAAWSRVVRRSARWGGGLGPALLGLATVLIPCGVTLGMEFLAVASGSALAGAAVMATFVVGTSPLFAAIGYLARRSTMVLRGRLALLAGTAVLVAGLVSLNSGLTLWGSPVTVSSAWGRLTSGGSRAAAGPSARTPTVGVDGVQRLVIEARDTGYTPSRLAARAGVPTEVVLRTKGNQGCTRAVVFPALRIQKVLPATGDTVIALGSLPPGTLRFTCSMGMYSGSIQAA
jgi:sulfite exporter TauE/SafE